MLKPLYLLLVFAVCALPNGSEQDPDVALSEHPQEPEFSFPELRLKEAIERVAAMSDQELQSSLEDLDSYYRPNWDRSTLDMYLLEVVRRGGESWTNFLDGLLVERQALGQDSVGWPATDLELLTALRRLTGKPDPLKVCVENEDPLESVFPLLPTIEVRLQNVDDVPFGFKDGGNYRTGRLARWRMEVRDDEGNVIRVRRRQLGMGGGVEGRRKLQPGEFWGSYGQFLGERSEVPEPLPLELRDYAEVPGPGQYTLVVQYHDHLTIAGEPDVGHLIVSCSDPVAFTVRPRSLSLSQEERDRIAAILPRLYEQRPVVKIMVPFRPEIQFAGEPLSPAEELYRHGWKALPVLIRALGEDTHVEHRAWLLVMLFGITGLNEPSWSEDRALGEVREGWLRGPRGGTELYLAGESHDGGPTEEGQRRLVGIWEAYADRLFE